MMNSPNKNNDDNHNHNDNVANNHQDRDVENANKVPIAAAIDVASVSNDLEEGVAIKTGVATDPSSLKTMKMEAFEIESDDTAAVGGGIDHDDEMMIPSIMTATSLDESIDDELIVEMESLLQPRNSKGNSKGSSGSDAPSVGSDNGEVHHTNSNTNNNSTTKSSASDINVSQKQVGNNQPQQSSRWCVPCLHDSDSNTTTSSQDSKSIQRLGNIYIIYPPQFLRCLNFYSNKSNYWLVIGPHWFGPPCVVGIVLFISYYIIYQKCYVHHQWYATMSVCVLLCTSTIYHLLLTAYTDPGIIVKHSLPINVNEPATIPRSYRFCDTCQYYQPNYSVHCPQCNVCIAGFDHHCVWMSICIGKNNYKPFMRFNLSWMAYFLYTVVWVSGIAHLFN